MQKPTPRSLIETEVRCESGWSGMPLSWPGSPCHGCRSGHRVDGAGGHRPGSRCDPHEAPLRDHIPDREHDPSHDRSRHGPLYRLQDWRHSLTACALRPRRPQHDGADGHREDSRHAPRAGSQCVRSSGHVGDRDLSDSTCEPPESRLRFKAHHESQCGAKMDRCRSGLVQFLAVFQSVFNQLANVLISQRVVDVLPLAA